MTALPLPPARHLTAAEFAALPEDSSARYELQEGNIVMSPSARPAHQKCMLALASRMAAAIPADLVVFPDVDLDLELVPPSRPGFVRAPDIVVATRSAEARVAADGGVLRACEVLLVVEILSPGSRRTDRVIKRAEYADAGIAHYWIVDIEGGAAALTACRLDGSSYAGDVTYRGVATLAEPFPLTVDLSTLV